MGDERTDGIVDGRRILVVANESATGTVLHEALRFRARNVGGEVLVVAPAPPAGRLPRTPDDDGARREAERRLASLLERLTAAGVRARGRLGDADPIQAIADALGVFAADEIVIATHPEGRSSWLAGDLVARARVRFDQPILHIVVADERPRGVVAAPRTGPPIASTPTLTAS